MTTETATANASKIERIKERIRANRTDEVKSKYRYSTADQFAINRLWALTFDHRIKSKNHVSRTI